VYPCYERDISPINKPIVIIDEMGRACSTNGGDEECIYDIGEKARRKEPLGRPRRRWNNIKMNLGEMVWTGSNWLRIGTSGGLL
jgi:hypothetical protein